MSSCNHENLGDGWYISDPPMKRCVDCGKYLRKDELDRIAELKKHKSRKELLKELLIENLSLDTSYDYDYGGKYLSIIISFDGEEICSEYVKIEDK
jgi:hypothetical protein